MILVTGGAGRIGRHLVAALAKKEKVRILLKGGEKFSALRNVEVFYGDLLDKESLKKAVYGCDTLYHLAAIVDYLAPKDLMWKVNVEGTQNIVEAAAGAGVKKLIYLSSTAVYGKKHPNPANEETSLRPSNYYGKTKAEAERVVLSHNGIVLRSADVFGKGFEEGYHAVFSMLQKGKMPVIGSGKNRIQYVHIDDLVNALLAAKNAKPGVYLVAGKEIKTQEELLGICSRHLGCKPPSKRSSALLIKMFVRLSMVANVFKGKRPELIPEYIDKLAADRTFSTEKAKRKLGFAPSVGYEQGIAEMIEEYKKRHA